MSRHKTRPTKPAAASALTAALEQNKDVKLRVEGAASHLSESGTELQMKMADGNLKIAANAALKVGREVEATVKECADDLHEVNEMLEMGVTSLQHTENELAVAHKALAQTQYSLAKAKAGELDARRAARHDALTGLPNREFFNSRLAHDIAVAARHDFDIAVMFFDLNKFKAVNDTYGHDAGDEILRSVAARLLQQCRIEDSACRTGGDEFLFTLIGPKGRDNVAQIASILVDVLSLPVAFEGHQIVVRPSIGISLYPEHAASASQLISKADAAMYQAKKAVTGPGWAFHTAPTLQTA